MDGATVPYAADVVGTHQPHGCLHRITNTSKLSKSMESFPTNCIGVGVLESFYSDHDSTEYLTVVLYV